MSPEDDHGISSPEIVPSDVPASAEPVPRVPDGAVYWLALSRLPGIGRVSYLRLLKAYHTPRDVWAHSDGDWKHAGLVRESFDSTKARAHAMEWAQKQVEALERSRWSLVVLGDALYPVQLTHLVHPAPFLFTRGIGFNEPALAVVGSRQATEYGARQTRDIVGEVAAAGVAIVSGFARGIDTIAHKAALSVKARTVAVWGCGPDVVYPAENRDLIDSVAESGLLVTEFPFGTPPETHNFPIRNRLIAGLADGVLVTQARGKSGALLTAHHAVEQGKNVYVIPGEVGNTQFVGSHALLKEGARIVTDASDILTDLGIGAAPRQSGTPRPLPPLTDIERRVYEGLGGSPCHVDRLAVSLGLSAGECVRVLLSLELKGLTNQAAGNMVSRNG